MVLRGRDPRFFMKDYVKLSWSQTRGLIVRACFRGDIAYVAHDSNLGHTVCFFTRVKHELAALVVALPLFVMISEPIQLQLSLHVVIP
jgi:hypothetical protein